MTRLVGQPRVHTSRLPSRPFAAHHTLRTDRADLMRRPWLSAEMQPPCRTCRDGTFRLPCRMAKLTLQEELAQADRHIAEGKERLAHQTDLAARLAAASHDTALAEELQDTMVCTL